MVLSSHPVLGGARHVRRRASTVDARPGCSRATRRNRHRRNHAADHAAEYEYQLPDIAPEIRMDYAFVEVVFLSGAASLKQCPGFRRVPPGRSPGEIVASARMRNERCYPRRPDQSSSHGCLADHLVAAYPRARRYEMSISRDSGVRTVCRGCWPGLYLRWVLPARLVDMRSVRGGGDCVTQRGEGW